MSTQSVTLTYAEFVSLTDPVTPFASRDETLPLLTGVRITASGGYVIARATDRYRAAFQRVRVTRPDGESLPDGFDALVSARAIAAIKRTFKPARRFVVDLTLTVTSDTLTVEASGTLGGFGSGGTLRFDLIQGNYPPIENLIPWGVRDGAASMALNAASLADLAKVAPVGMHGVGPVVIHPAPRGKPVLITHGEDFVALIQPVRFDDDKEGDKTSGDTWRSILAAPTPAAKPKRTRKADAA